MARWGMRVAGAVAFYVVLGALFTNKPGIIVQGIVVGGLTALIAFGISLVYRANRIVSFAQGDLGAVPAALSVLLIVGSGWPFLAAFGAGLAVAVVLGVLVELLVMRRFAKAPRLILTVATIGLAQVFAGISVVLPSAFDLRVPPQSYPTPFDWSFSIDPITFQGDDVLAMLAVPLAIVGLTFLLQRTHIGLAIRASAESTDRASLVGVPVGQVRIVVWVVASTLAFVAIFLRAGIFGLPIGSVLGPTILLRALAAAVIGKMENLPRIFVAAAAIGIIESAVVFTENSSLLVDPIVFVVLLVTLAVQHRDRVQRVFETSSWRATGDVRPIPRELASLPEVRWGRRALLGVALLGAIVLPAFLGEGDTNRAAAVVIYGIVAISLVVLTGWSGQVSLGQVAFMGIGAGVGGVVTSEWNWDLSVALVIAGAAGAVVALVVGLPALRVRGLLLAVITLSLALAVSSYVLNRNYLDWVPEGRIPRTPLFGRIILESETRYYYFCLAVLVAVLGMVKALRAGRTGRVLIAARENERATQAYGVNVTRAKLTAFAVSGFLAAMAGALFVHHQQTLGVNVFRADESLRVFTMTVIGGLGSVPGALLGAVYVQSTQWFQTWLPSSVRPLLGFLGTGVGLLVVLMLVPGGLGSLLYRARDALLRTVARRRGIVVPSLLADVAVEGPAVSPASLAPVTTTDLGDRALLRIERLEVRYDNVQVLFGVDLEVAPGEVVALLGTNGAGKSTVLRAVSGLVQASSGSITFGGQDLVGVPAHRICAQGLVQAPGGAGVFPSLTVHENLRLALWLERADSARCASAIDDAFSLFPELRGRADEPAGNLSGGQQQMLTLAMAFLARPKLLMIDELSLGLAPTIVERLLDVVETIRTNGTAIILVEQSVNVALTAAKRAYFLEKGEVRFDGPTDELLARPDVLRSVFLEGAATRDGGASRTRRAAPARAAAPTSVPGAAVLELRSLRRSFGGVVAVDDVDLSVAAGEIVGLIGPNGAGKTTLFDLISGFVPVGGGQVLFEGLDLTRHSPDERARLGLGRSFQDARLFPGLTVAETIAVALDREAEVHDPLAIALGVSAATAAEAHVAARVDELIDRMGLAAFRDKFVAELSTGTRRIVDLACIAAREPRVILFDEPSSGIAQREAEALGPLLARLRDDTGAALLVIEHDMPLVSGIADRLVALDLGRVIAAGDPADVLHHPAVVESYLGGRPEVIARSGRVAAKAKAPTKAGAR